MSTHPHSTTHVATGFPSTHHTEHDNERRPTGDDSDDADIEELDDSDDEEAGPPTQREPHLPDNPAVPPINNAPQSLDIAAATYRSTGPNSRFKSVAMRVMAMHRTSAALRMPGSEPGIDPRRSTAQSQYGHLRQRCSIEVISYGALKATHDVLQNEDLAAYLKKERPVWARVRWIKVGGISWDVIKPLGITFGQRDMVVAKQIMGAKIENLQAFIH